jgi:hypothetical protein
LGDGVYLSEKLHPRLAEPTQSFVKFMLSDWILSEIQIIPSSSSIYRILIQP